MLIKKTVSALLISSLKREIQIYFLKLQEHNAAVLFPFRMNKLATYTSHTFTILTLMPLFGLY